MYTWDQLHDKHAAALEAAKVAQDRISELEALFAFVALDGIGRTGNPDKLVRLAQGDGADSLDAAQDLAGKLEVRVRWAGEVIEYLRGKAADNAGR